MKKHLLNLMLIVTSLVFIACGESTTETVPGKELSAPHDWAQSSPGSTPAPGLTPDANSTARQTRRITVDQMRRSIPDLFGGETWILTQGRNSYQGFDVLARTLGEADYNEVTESVTEPSPLFQKFMNDMAAQMCTKAVEHDLSEADAAARWVIRAPSDLDETLRFLRLKFHGIYVASDADTDSDGLGDLRQLFSDIEADAGMESAWLGLCMAVLTAPEFLAY